MLIFPLKKEWYEKIKRGEKTLEYREVKPYWKIRFKNAHCLPRPETGIWCFKKSWLAEPISCLLQCGYNPKLRLSAKITKIEVVDGKYTDLNIDKHVYAIHLSDVREVQ